MTSKPCSLSNAATTEESTPPDIATTTRVCDAGLLNPRLLGSSIPPGAGFSFMAVAHRSINWPANIQLPRTGVIRYSGSKASIPVRRRCATLGGQSGSPKRETWRLLYRHEHEPALRGNLIY